MFTVTVTQTPFTHGMMVPLNDIHLLMQLSAVVCIGACCALLCLCTERKTISVAGKWQWPVFAYNIVNGCRVTWALMAT